MPIALEIGAGIGGAGFICGIGCVPIYDSPEIKKAEASYSPSSSSSSIGKDSDELGSELDEDEGAGTGEVQSAYNGLESLEESLPIRRGISNFYAGKAKSFTSLSVAVASCASAKDLAKAENAYTRRQRNLLASKIFWEKPRSNMLRSPVGGGIVKRPGAPKRSPLALAVAMNSTPKTGNFGESEDDNHLFLPPLRPSGKSALVVEGPVDSSSSQPCSIPIRSFSLGDLPVLKNPDSSI